ncbi:hypothetical protein Ancab_022230 [Ancistrocladus abbreviatus]
MARRASAERERERAPKSSKLCVRSTSHLLHLESPFWMPTGRAVANIPKMLESELNQVWIGSYKIHANLARFSRHGNSQAKQRTGKSHAATRVKQHRRSYADAVNGMAPRTETMHNSAEMKNNEKMAPRTGMKHNAVDTQNNEKPLMVFTSKEEDGEGPLSPLAREGSITLGPQGLNRPLHSPSNPVAGNSLLHIDRESLEDIVRLRTEMASNQKIRKKSLAEIPSSKLSTDKHGCRSKRVHRQLMNTGVLSSHLFTDAEDSGIDLNDSQIENMNRIICKQDSYQADTEQSPTLSHIWSFLTRIGVKGTTTAEDMVNHIKTMEQRDLKNFLETIQVPKADCDQVG